jgi:hypothetical protein
MDCELDFVPFRTWQGWSPHAEYLYKHKQRTRHSQYLPSCWRWHLAETGPAFNRTSKNRRKDIVVEIVLLY